MENVIKFGNDYIELIFFAKWHYVQSLWDFIKGLLSIFLRENKKSDILSMAIIELVENAVKYSSCPNGELPEIRFKLHMRREEKRIEVEVENPTTKEQIDIFKGELERIQNAEDPQVMFREKLKEAALRDDGKSQLGLVRIIIEAGARLEVVEKENFIVVKANFKLEEKN